MSPLQEILATYRATSKTEREKGTYFEELIRTYFRFEATYADLYSEVWLYADRGKLIMACGTGKTFTSLKIAEEVAGKNKRVLFLVPSLNLLSETLTEWTQESAIPLHSFAVCSDAEVGKKRSKDDDIVETYAHELRYPATTDAKRLAFEMKQRHDAGHMSVVFSTYHSIKVIVLTIDEAHVSARIQDLLKDESNQLNVDDAARIIGCWKALSKKGLAEDLSGDADPMRRAVAFCQVIERSTGRVRKVSSKQIAGMFEKVVSAYQAEEDSNIDLICEAAHVDGGMNASQKEEKLDWLKAPSPDNTCRILSNVRCLSEGVDVPALDAVLFLTLRNSQVDVVQSVGRVMRNAPGEKRGAAVQNDMACHPAQNKVISICFTLLAS